MSVIFTFLHVKYIQKTKVLFLFYINSKKGIGSPEASVDGIENPSLA